MNSVQLLKKDNATLSKGQKEHKRSEHIQQLNKEIGDQDTVIDVLRGMIPDQKRADAAVIERLSKGPARIRIPTREELKIEIKELKGKLLKYEKKKGQTGTAAEDEVSVKDETGMQSMATITKADIGGKIGAGNAEFIMKINDLNNEIEDLNLVVSGKNTEVEKYKQLISKKNQEIIELSQSKVDLKFMITKNEELKGEIESLRKKLNSDLYQNYDAQIKLEELELAAAMHKNIQNKTNETVKLEVENAQNKLFELINQNKLLLMTNTKLKEDVGTLRASLDDAKERNRKLASEHDDQTNKLVVGLKEKDAALKAIHDKIESYEKQFDELNVEIKNKETQINELEQQIQEGGFRRAGSELDLSHISQAEVHGRDMEAKKLELGKRFFIIW